MSDDELAAIIVEAENIQATPEVQGFESKIDELFDKYEAYMLGMYPLKFSEAENAELYNCIYIPASKAALGVLSFKLTGTVTVKSEATYLPVRVWNANTSCLNDTCTAISYPWTILGALPDYSLTDAELNADIAQQQTDEAKGVNVPAEFRATNAATDGRLGASRCAPTSENYTSWDVLGTDTVQAPERNVAELFIGTYNLNLRTEPFFVSGYGVNEDGCDQADVLVTLCDEPEPEPETPDTPTHEEPNNSENPTTGGPGTPDGEVGG